MQIANCKCICILPQFHCGFVKPTIAIVPVLTVAIRNYVFVFWFAVAVVVVAADDDVVF